MKSLCLLLVVVQLGLVIPPAWSQSSGTIQTTGCPVEDDPSNLARCIQIDVTAIVDAIRGSKDYSSFCALANRYMECFTTYTRGCPGQYFAQGGFAELQNIAQYCCNGIASTTSCPFNPNIKRSCIDNEANATLSDGSFRSVKSLQIGDKVKTLDSNGQLVDTEVVMIMDISDQESLFLNVQTYSGKSVKVSSSHLIAVPGGEFKFAKNLNKEDMIVTYDFESKQLLEERVSSILIEPVQGYSAPLTMSGTLLVDGVLASCYAIIDSHKIAHAVMAPARWWYSMNEMLETHVSESVSSSISIEKQLNGTHWYPAMWDMFTSHYLTKVIQLH